MACPSDSELVQLSAGRDPGQISAHVTGCGDCTARLQRLRLESPTQEGVEHHATPAENSPSVDLKTGDKVGRYVVVGFAGEGGMGRVYKAFDPELNRPVALKLLNVNVPAAVAPDARARLLREAQAMARLGHPNVVAIYDVGTHDDGVFLAMELVDGVTLREWLTTSKSWRQIVEVFHAAGKGLAAAHEAGLVHRDFKPGNVLVARDGQVKVLDFGLARAANAAPLPPLPIPLPIEPSHSLETPLTREGVVNGTVGYVAPELLRGEPGDARVDQFAFGVSLFEALHGVRPWSGRTMVEFARALQQTPAPVAPAGSTPAWVDAVALRAIRLEPNDRFESMKRLLSALAADPVLVRRRLLGAVAILAALGGIAFGAVKNSAPQCDPARRLDGVWDAPARATLLEVFNASGRIGAQDTAERVIHQLNTWTAEWVTESTAACNDQRTAKGADQESALLRMVCLERRRGEFSALAGVFASADRTVVDQAVSASKLLLAPSRCREPRKLSGDLTLASPEDRLKADALHARLDVAKARFDSGQFPAAIDAAKKIAEEAAAAHLDSVQAEALNLLGKVQGRSFQLDEAIKSLTAALASAQTAHAELEVFFASVRLAHVLNLSGKPAEAEKMEKLGEAALAQLGDDALLRTDLLEAQAGTAARLQRFEAALELRQQVRDARRKLLGDEHPETIASTINLAKTLGDLGRLRESTDFTRLALTTSRQSLGKDHPALIVSSCNLCYFLTEVGEYDEARSNCEEGARLAERIHGEKTPLNGWCLANLSNVFAQSGRGKEAVVTADRAVSILSTIHGADHLELAEPLLYRARGLLLLGHFEQADADLRHAMAIAEKNLAADDASLSEYLTTQAFIALGAKRPKDALAPIERALVLRAHGFASDRADSRFALAQALWDSKGDRIRAVEQAKLAVTELEGIPGLTIRKAAVEQWLRSNGQL